MKRTKTRAASGVIGGWNITNDAIFSGTKSTVNGFSTSGITLAADGSLHAERFYVNADGTVGIRSGTATGKRVVIDSVNNRIDIYSAGNIGIIRLDDNIDGLYPGIAVMNPGDPTDKMIVNHGAVDQYINGTKVMSLNGSGIWLQGIPTGGSGLKAVYYSTTDGKLYRAT